jgi:hypothetical protein
MLLEGALGAVAKEYGRGEPRWISGGVHYIDDRGNNLGTLSAPPQWMGHRIFASLGWPCLNHQATYVAKDFFEELGGFNLKFKVAADYELFARALSRCQFRRVRRPLAVFRITGVNDNLAKKDVAGRECAQVGDTFAPKPAAQRLLYRTALRLWVNATNPEWFVRKYRG